jgi:hypothetical protein
LKGLLHRRHTIATAQPILDPNGEGEPTCVMNRLLWRAISDWPVAPKQAVHDSLARNVRVVRRAKAGASFQLFGVMGAF